MKDEHEERKKFKREICCVNIFSPVKAKDHMHVKKIHILSQTWSRQKIKQTDE